MLREVTRHKNVRNHHHGGDRRWRSLDFAASIYPTTMPASATTIRALRW